VPRTAVLIACCTLALVIGVPFGILLLLDPSSSEAACSSSTTGAGPTNVAGIPTKDMPYFDGASQQFDLGPDGWAYLAAINSDESTFDTSNLPGVFSGTNSAGAAGPMQLGVGGAAGDTWDEYRAEIPPGLQGGAQPPSVYNEADAVYAGAAKLSADGAPSNWQAALVAWNDYPPEISYVNLHVAAYLAAAQNSSQGSGTDTDGTSSVGTDTDGTAPIGTVTGGGPATVETTATTSTGASPACGEPVTGPTVPGSTAKIEPNGLAEIPENAPEQVKEALAAGNRLIDTFYSEERRDNMLSVVQDSYDCSGTTDFILYNAGFDSPLIDVGDGIAGDSSEDAEYGGSGAGKWITVFGSDGHAFIEVAGIVMDTAYYAPVDPSTVSDPEPAGDPDNGGPDSGPRWQPASIIPQQLQDGNVWSTRHPAGF
jgi:hypothetical protein